MFFWGRASATNAHAADSGSDAEFARVDVRPADEAAASSLAAPAAAADATARTVPEPSTAGDSEDGEFAGLAHPRIATVREICEDFHGLPWEELRQLLDVGKVDPDTVVHVYPWEQVAPHVRRELLRTDDEARREQSRQIVGWGGNQQRPSFYRGMLNPTQKPLAPIDVQNLERVSAEFDSRLNDVAAAVNELLPRCMADQFDRGNFDHTPVLGLRQSPTASKPKASEFRRTLSTQGAGWAVTLRFQSADYPELERLGNEVRALKRERYERLREYIDSL